MQKLVNESLEEFLNYKYMNENWKTWVTAGLFILSTLSSIAEYSSPIKDTIGQEVAAKTDSTISQKEAQKFLKDSLKNGFSNYPGSLPINSNTISSMSEGNYIVINVLGQTFTAAKMQAQSLRNEKYYNKIEKNYELYKINENKTIEVINIIHLKD